MRLRSPIVAAALAAAVSAQAPHHLVEVRVTGPAQMQRLLALDLDLASCSTPLLAQRRVEVIAGDRDLATLRTAGLQFQVLQRNLEAYYAAQAARFRAAGPDLPNPPLGQGAMGGHWTLAQMEAIVDALHAQNPAICAQKVSIGTTIENRPIWMIKISDNVGIDENEPEVLYDALHHAREPLSLEATVVFMDWLVTNYGTDPEATFLVDERELYFVPCLNPDGYEYNRQTNPGGGGMWRKNRRNNGDGTFGVDLNRNYTTGWTAPNGGNSTATNSETYRGTAPFSEPETVAIEAFAASRQFVTLFTTHTYQDVLLRPWGYQLGDPANVAGYNALGSYFVQENGLQHGSIGALLYIAAGTAVDHYHAVRGTWAFSAELGRSNEGGFWPVGPAIVDIATRHQPMFHKVALTAGAALDVDAVLVTEAAGGNGNNTVEAGESGNVVVTVRNQGVAATNATVALQIVTPGLVLGTASVPLGAVPALSTASNGGTPLSFSVPVAFPLALAQLRVVVTGDGRTTERLVNLQLVSPRRVLDDDFEQDRGFRRAAVNTATTGLWERAAPQQTVSSGATIQPGVQTTPGGTRCWVTDGRAGASASTYDVDNGYTDLLSPVLDLRHLQAAEARLQLWYAESLANDAVEIAISRDGGGSFTPAFSRTTSTGAFVPVAIDLGTPLTAQMRIRVRAQDLAASLVECLVDDFELRGVVADGSISLASSGALGSSIRLGMNAAPGALCFGLASAALTAGNTFPGIGGTLFLDPAGALALPALLASAGGHVGTDVPIPNLAGLAGLTFHWQLATLAPAGITFGPNVVSITLF